MGESKAGKPTKRQRLVESAVALASRQGFRRTTLADIAEESGVPLGNIFYYFKSKDEIGDAILARREGDFDYVRDRLDALPEPRDRLIGFIEMTMSGAESVSILGCPRGSLASEVLKDGGPLADRSNNLFARPMAWMGEQFKALGHAAEAEALALQLQSSLQGASLMAQSFRDPSLLEREGARLIGWISGL